jgi:hypothetical protein
MSDATLYSEDMYVLLVPGAEEVFLTPEELQSRLQTMLASHQDNLPRDLQTLSEPADQAQRLMQTACEFEVTAGHCWQWYAVRLEK